MSLLFTCNKKVYMTARLHGLMGGWHVNLLERTKVLLSL